MISVQIVLHCFAHEIDEFQRIVEHLKRNLGFVDGVRWKFMFTLNVSDRVYNWNESKMDRQFFVSKFQAICSMLSNCSHKVITSNMDYGCNSIRREAARFCKDDYVCYLDTDLHFSVYTLFYISEALKNIHEKHSAGVILSAQILRLWDNSWNIISNDDYIKMGVESKIWLKYDPFTIDSDVFGRRDNITLKRLPYIKFGGGWFNIFSTDLLNFIDIPDSLGAYGRDDTFVAEAVNIMKKKNIDVQQYVIDNLLVCENRLYRDYEPYNDFLVMTEDRDDYKKRHAMEADSAYRNELVKFQDKLK